MLIDMKIWSLIFKCCVADGGKTKSGSRTYKFIGFDTTSKDEKEQVIRFDNRFYFRDGEHIISNIDKLKEIIGYKGMTYDEFCARMQECMDNGKELDDIDW